MIFITSKLLHWSLRVYSADCYMSPVRGAILAVPLLYVHVTIY